MITRFCRWWLRDEIESVLSMRQQLGEVYDRLVWERSCNDRLQIAVDNLLAHLTPMGVPRK